MPALLLRPTVLLAIALALSLLANLGLWKLHAHDLRTIGALQAQRDQAVAVGRACSDGVRKLREAADRRAREVALALRTAAEQAYRAQLHAQATLQARPAVPGDACASALALDRQKLAERRAR